MLICLFQATWWCYAVTHTKGHPRSTYIYHTNMHATERNNLGSIGLEYAARGKTPMILAGLPVHRRLSPLCSIGTDGVRNITVELHSQPCWLLSSWPMLMTCTYWTIILVTHLSDWLKYALTRLCGSFERGWSPSMKYVTIRWTKFEQFLM